MFPLPEPLNVLDGAESPAYVAKHGRLKSGNSNKNIIKRFLTMIMIINVNKYIAFLERVSMKNMDVNQFHNLACGK
ncbi:hypothetical protein ASD24_18120 [Paenibacillus sp. Root52]|nr:hypothetical protein ASD24_18120 [Paenibacillus sp. Root52]